MATSTILLDTTVLVDHLRGHTTATVWLGGLAEVPLCSEITRAEVIAGLRSPEKRAAEQLFAALRWINVDESISRAAGELGRRYRKGHDLGVADLVIAATAQDQSATLATSNVKHYPMFPKLRPPY